MWFLFIKFACFINIMPGNDRRKGNRISQMDVAREAVSLGHRFETGFKKQFISSDIGYGVFAECAYEKGDFLLQYKGDLLHSQEANFRDEQYKTQNVGCFMFFFKHLGEDRCIDATHSDGLGRMCNDEQKKPNAVMKKVEINNGIHLCLFALRSIKVGEEVRYDYGPDDGSMHWRKHTEKKQKCRESVIAQEPETETVTKLKRPEQPDDELAGEKQKDNLITVSSAEAKDTLCLCNKEVIASTRGDELPVSEKHSDELIMAETIGNKEMTVKDTEKKQKCRESVIAQEPETETVTKLKRPEQSDDELAGEKQKDNLITVSSAEAIDTLCLCNKEVIASTRDDELPVSEKHSDEQIMAETVGNKEMTVKHTEKKQKCRESVIAQEPETETVTKLKRPEQSDDELAGEKQKDNLIKVSSAEAMDTLCLYNKEVIASTRGDELPVSEKHSDELIMAETVGNEEMTVKHTEKKQKCRESVIAQEPETETVTKLKRPEQSDDELAGEKQKDNLIKVSSAEAMDTLCLYNKEVIASTRGDELPVSEKHSDELIMAETVGNEEMTVKHTEKKQKCRESVIAQEPETETVTKLKRPEQSDDELAGEKQKDNLIKVSSAEAMDTLCLYNKEVIASTRGDELPVSEKHSDELIMAETVGNEEMTVKHTEKKQKCRESVIAQEPETETVTKLKRPEQSDDELAGEKQKDNLIKVSSAEAMDTLCLYNKEVIASTRGDELPVSEKHSDELIMAETVGNEEMTVKHTEKKQKCRESVIAQEPETETVTKLKRPEQSDDELAGEKQKDNLITVSSAEAIDTLCLCNKEVIASTRDDELPVSEKHSDEQIMAETVGNEEMTAKHTEKKQKCKETALKCSAAETIGSEGVALIKVEDSNGRYRPLFKQHNMLRTFNPDSSFSYSIFDEPVSMNRTTKRYTQGKLQKKAGFCECCEYSFENYAKHVNGFQHKMYALTAKNYKGIDEQIADLTIEMFLMKRSSSTRIDIPENQSSNASSISTEQNKTNEQSTIHVEHVEMLQCTRRFTQLVEYSDSTDSRISSNNVVIPHPANALLVEGAENTSENDESSSMISTAQLPADEKHLNNLIMAESKAVETLGNRKVTLEHTENGHKDKETVISSHMNTCFDYIEDSSCSTGSIACLNYSSLTNKLMEKLNKSESCDNDNLLRRKVADRGYLGFEDSEEDVEPDSDAEEGSDSGSLELCCLSDNELWRKTNNKSKCVESSFKPDQDSSNNDDSILDPDYVPEDISACNSMDSENSDKSLSSEEFPRSKVKKACLKSSNSDHVFCIVPKSLSTISVDTDVNENDDLLLDDNEIRPTVDKGFGEKAENQAVLFEKSGIIPRKKTYDKIHFCTFCGTGIKGKIQRHLLNVHKNETEVAEIHLLPKRDKEQSRLLKKLTNEGNFKHNINVLRVGEGKLVVGRRSEIPSKYTVCVYCKKWQSKKNLWRHTKTCVESIEYHKNHPSDETGKKPRIMAVKQGQSLINNAVFENNEDNLSHLVYRMRDDEIKEVSMTDPLIRREAGLRMSGLGRQIDQKQDDIYRVSQSARLLGRVLLHAREFKIGISLTELLVPNNFDFVVDIAKKMSTDKDNPA